MLFAVFLPLLGSFFLPLAGRISGRLRNFMALTVVTASFIFSLSLIPRAMAGETVSFSISLPLGLNLVFAADCLAVFMAGVSSFISAVIILYSFAYISHYQNQNEYYFMVVLFLGAMMGLVFCANLVFIYLFWEITAITSWRLIGFFRERQHVLRADKSFLVTVFGALVMLVGFIMVYQESGSFDLAAIKGGGSISNPAVLLILFGIFSKSATLPFQTWLPDAGVAPSPVTALLHAAVLVKIGVYVFARLFVVTFPIDQFWHTAVPFIAGASAVISAGAALVETDIKRIIAYSTISQIAFIFLGFSVISSIGIAGALLYILMHGLAKGGLFLCAGIVEQNTGVRDIRKLGGLIQSMPVTATAFLFCAFSIMGIPPFGGFFGKYMVIAGALGSGHTTVSVIFLIAAVMTILYLFRLFNNVFMGEPQGPAAREGSSLMVLSVVILAALSLLAGIYIGVFSGFLRIAVQQMTGGVAG